MMSLRQLETEEGRREYYSYNPRDPLSLVPRSAPYLSERFNEELLEKYGTDIWGDQRIRIVWAPEVDQLQYYEDQHGNTYSYQGKRYPYMRIERVIGFCYRNAKGEHVTVTTEDRVPEGAIAEPVTIKEDLPKLHFVVEMKYTLEEMIALKWCPDPATTEGEAWCVRNGKRYRDTPDPRGEYMLAYPIVTADGQYRDVTDDDLRHIHEIVRRVRTESPEEYVARKKDEFEKLTAVAEAEKAEKEADKWSDAFIRAERRQAQKGRIIFTP